MFWEPWFLEEGGNARHIAIDGKTMRASKDSEGKAEHVLSAFCSSLQTVLGHEASRSKDLEIPDALKLLERLDLRGKIVTGDAIFCQKSIAAKIVERGGAAWRRSSAPDIARRQTPRSRAWPYPASPACRWQPPRRRTNRRVRGRADAGRGLRPRPSQRRSIPIIGTPAPGSRKWNGRRCCRGPGPGRAR